MVRVALLGLALSGCSLVLDFGKGAIPVDAQADGPSTQTECDYKEPNDVVAMAAVVAPADVGPGAICDPNPDPDPTADDRDFYKFTVPAMTAAVTVRITFTNRPTGDLDLRITDSSGATTYGQSRGFGDGEAVVCPGSSPACPTLAPGDYVFEVFPAVPGALNRYEMSLAFTPM
jgi:hypothetical protein